jgi:hypothetical protein
MMSHSNDRSPSPKRNCPSPNFTTQTQFSGMDNRLLVIRITPSTSTSDFRTLSSDLAQSLLNSITSSINTTTNHKVHFRVKVQFFKATEPEHMIEHCFVSYADMINHSTNVQEIIRVGLENINKHIEAFINMGSGWVANKVMFIDVYILKYQQFTATSYMKLPSPIALSRAVINIKNNDTKCFTWSVLAALHPVHYLNNANRVSKYAKYEHELNMTGISYPVPLAAIDQFEAQNNLAINVFGYQKNLYPLRISKSPHPIINLLYLSDEQNSHYAWIKDLDKLCFKESKHKCRKFFCPRCLTRLSSEQKRTDHLKYCQTEDQRVDMPEQDFMEFKNYKNQIPQPLVIYADFESFIQPIDTCHPSTQGSFTTKIQKHQANSYAFLPVYQCCENVPYEAPTIYRGTNAVRHFLLQILKRGEQYQAEYDHKQGMHMSYEDRTNFDAAQECYICHQPYESHGEGCSCGRCRKVRDHCHLCARYRGAAHSSCNVQYYLDRKVVVMLHNLKNYDGHLIMQELGSVAHEMKLELSCVPKSTEEYLSFTVRVRHTHRYVKRANGTSKAVSWDLRFVDSFQFMSSSLASLVDNLLSSGEDKFELLQREIPSHLVKLCLRKGVYPYEHAQSWSVFNETQLPERSMFYSKLTDEHISEDDYTHAQNVWKTFGFRKFGEYHDLYLTLDVLLLADVFQNFRKFARRYYNLDPAHYITLPSFGWDAMLQMTGVRLELLQDVDMYLFLEGAIRGGTSVIPNRRAEANNKYLPNFDPTKPSTYIIYLDMNNLYGGVQEEPLPISDFKWCRSVNVMEVEDDSIFGYILEVDLSYPEELHDKHNDFPLAPEKMVVEEVSPYCQMIAEKLNLKRSNVQKLVPNLYNKKNYVVHYRMLRFLMEEGMIVTKVHRVLKFKQSKWMAPYIQFNTSQRKKSKSEFEKNQFKLLNNAMYGKSMENVRAYIDLKLVTDEKKFNKFVASPLFQESHPFNEHLIGLSMRRESVILNKPIYAGFSILDISKLWMYTFHYRYMVEKYGSNCRLMLTDTDSLLYEIKTEDFYEDILPDLDTHFDMSDYPAAHKCYSGWNKKKPGYMKDELNGQVATSFVGLRSKMYSIKVCTEEKKRAKGVAKSVVRKVLSHEDYERVQEQGILMRHEMTTFRSENHEIYTTHLNKVSLCAFDDKRYVLDDGNHTLAPGHYRIKT